jgi:hypothetical protein
LTIHVRLLIPRITITLLTNRLDGKAIPQDLFSARHDEMKKQQLELQIKWHLLIINQYIIIKKRYPLMQEKDRDIQTLTRKFKKWNTF